MNFSTAKKHHKAALQTARYYRFLMLLAKKPTAANEERVARQREVAIKAMRMAMGKPMVEIDYTLRNYVISEDSLKPENLL
jgi:hypothetical protein